MVTEIVTAHIILTGSVKIIKKWGVVHYGEYRNNARDHSRIDQQYHLINVDKSTLLDGGTMQQYRLILRYFQ